MERCHGRARPDRRPVARQFEADRTPAVRALRMQVDEPDGLVHRPSPRPRHAGYGDGDIRSSNPDKVIQDIGEVSQFFS